ncbi:YceI family protein [Sulfurimonas sp. HSL-3221]|uniref:YceI family protein n=1 Tax=Sulfurimonadaceae TaxID=2771471 RepID=UPI001E57BA35|nr:YceI family protein [Sulfurimonas sp. HSL-3221]UFS61532.1 YceI family protein [Sulfurimonas sp. HSL-3221]
MKIYTRMLGAAAALSLSTSLLLGAVYDVDPTHSNVGFKIRHMMISNVNGRFAEFSGNYDLEGKVLKALSGTIKSASVDTDNAKRDDHLRSADFFDVAKYPEITFTMTSFDGDSVTGELTIHGVTRTVTLEAEVSGTIKDPWGMTRSSIILEGSIKRSDFGLTYNQVLEAGGVALSDKVKITIELEGIAKPV